ncbi:sulfatase-like hydrolase/transferase [Flavobacterium fluviatile]|uniref:sulfatase-like hydrolase/transferase n=1 Tax=Flavobacterium fluviatile TaxID=1862387 RepID=UPI0013D4C365|nr:sulfatase-like hydrolase/transferase [Flavobacterium fluviatile]
MKLKNNCNKDHTKKYILLTLVLSLFSIFVEAQTNGARPNIIVILADDLGYADVGFNRTAAFPEDLGIINTPNIDALAKGGIICKNAHVAHPFCGPSRAALLTGMYPHRIGAQYNLPNDINTPLGIPTTEIFFSNLLQDANYTTGAIGKWHLGFTEGSYQPLDRGFDFFFGFLGGGKNYFEYDYEDNFYKRLGGSNPVTNEYQDPLQRNRNYIDRTEFSNAVNDDYLTDVLTDEAIGFINNATTKSDPFFLYLAYNAPHTPLEAPEAEIAKFKLDNPNFENLVRNSAYITQSTQVTKITNAAARAAKIEEFVQDRITYATMVTNMDTNIGRIVAELKKNPSLYNNTLIVFLSDNGGYTYSKGAVNYPLDGLKGSVQEGGHRVPMFVHWPSKIAANGTFEHQISSLDLYPTLVNVAGATMAVNKTIDGKDFMDKMISGEDVRPENPLYIMRPPNGFHNGAIILDKWKITKTGGNGSWRLYDIINDPGETTDLRKTEPNAETIIAQMLAKAVAWVKDFQNVKPAWFDNDDGGEGHPHDALWADGTLPAYDKLFESSELSLGIDDLLKADFSVYPNPSSDYFYLNFNQAINRFEIEIVTTTGSVIKKEKGTNENKPRINVSQIPAGTYILRIMADDKIAVEKIIKI